MPQPWKLEQETPSVYQVFTDIFRSFRGVPFLAWVFLVLGLAGLLFTQGHAALELPPPVPHAPQATGLLPTLIAGWRYLPWLGMTHEISIAAVIAFFLTLFLEEPIRRQTITRVGRDIAPFLIAALTVPEMRFKMRQICESAVIRKNSKLTLWIDENPADAAGNSYLLRVQMRSHYCNISSAQQEIRARVGVDADRNGRILTLALRPVQIPDMREHLWSHLTDTVPAAVDGRQTVEIKTTFPRSDDWENSYIEGTSEYQEEIALNANVGRTLIESLWPLVGVEIECVQRPGNVELKVDIPFHEIRRIGKTDRWISTAALLPGQRVDLVLTKLAAGAGATTAGHNRGALFARFKRFRRSPQNTSQQTQGTPQQTPPDAPPQH